jgi:hypothetical protein
MHGDEGVGVLVRVRGRVRVGVGVGVRVRVSARGLASSFMNESRSERCASKRGEGAPA